MPHYESPIQRGSREHEAIVATLRAENQRLREALGALIEDVNTYGEPRRHKDVIRAAEVAMSRNHA